MFKGDAWEFPTVTESLSGTLKKVKGKAVSEKGLVILENEIFKDRI